MSEHGDADRSKARSAFVFWGVGVLFVIALFTLSVASQAVLLAFAGVLFGTSLRGLATWLAGKLRWSVGRTLVLCIVFGIAACVGVMFWIVPQIDQQVGALVDRVSKAYDQVQAQLQQTELGRRLIGGSVALENSIGQIGKLAGVVASLLGAIGSGLFVGFVALYIAASPEVYRRGVLQLVPPARRARIATVLDALARTLRRWMLGRMVSMTAVGIATTIGLWILGIPMASTLGLLSGLLGFVPNLGPIASAVPALLLAATIDVPHILYVLGLYVVINIADGYILTPWIERKAVSTPAALVIVAQLVAGALWGIVGLTLATPLLACFLVIVRMLYVEDVLERRPRESQGANNADGRDRDERDQRGARDDA